MAKSATNSTAIIMDDRRHGRLLDWELIIDVTPCNANQPRWTRLPSPPIEFVPRRLHTAVAVGGSIFITGGYSATTRRLDDMWRFDFDTNTWTDLTTGVDGHRYLPLYYGQASLLGPWGVLAYGGMTKKYGTRNRGFLLFDLSRDYWVPVPISSSDYSDIPRARYLSSIGLLTSNDMNSSSNENVGPMILTFGGDGGLLHNTRADDDHGLVTNSLFNDIGLLLPGGWRIGSSSTMAQRGRYDLCHWRNIPNSTTLRDWDGTCGIIIDHPLPSSKVGGRKNGSSSADGGGCHLESILIAAWCQGQYQSF